MPDIDEAVETNEQTMLLYGEVRRWRVALAKAKAETKDAREALTMAEKDFNRHMDGLKPMPLFDGDDDE